MKSTSEIIKNMGTREILDLISNRRDFFPSVESVVQNFQELTELNLYEGRVGYIKLTKGPLGTLVPGTDWYTSSYTIRVRPLLLKWLEKFDHQTYIVHEKLGGILINRYKVRRQTHLVNEFTKGNYSYSIIITGTSYLKAYLGPDKKKRLKKWGEIREIVKSTIP